MNTPPLPWISVVIPIKDERDNIPLLANQLLEFFEVRPESETAPFELVFVDDGSTDGSESLLDELVQQSEAVRIIHLDKNHGQTAAFDAGFRQAKGEGICNMIPTILLNSCPWCTSLIWSAGDVPLGMIIWCAGGHQQLPIRYGIGWSMMALLIRGVR
jgi:hypothetical protein